MTRRPRLSEAAWQRRVMDLARWHGWWVMHVPDSRRVTAAGWPDLVLLREQLLLVELKAVDGRLSTAQKDCHMRLARAGIPVEVWRPDDWNTVQTVLEGHRRR